MPKTVRKVISGARVAFDPRTTAEVDASRDNRNRVTEQKPQRIAAYLERKKREEKQRQSA